MRSVPVEHFDVFPRGDEGGNPCPVVVDAADLSADELQSIAAHFGQETGAVVADPETGRLRLRYFVPAHEMAMCVHATVAIVTALAASGAIEGGSVDVDTAAGECRLAWTDGEPPSVTVEQQTPVVGDVVESVEVIEHALGLPAGALDVARPVRTVSVSRPKLIVPVRRAADLHAAEPDLPALWRSCSRLGATGAYPFAPHDDGRGDHVVARQFPVGAGFPEDPATGVAAGALAVYLAAESASSVQRWVGVDIDQGDAMGRPSTLGARALVDATGVHRSLVTGRAIHRGTEVIDLDAVLAAHPGIHSVLR